MYYPASRDPKQLSQPESRLDELYVLEAGGEDTLLDDSSHDLVHNRDIALTSTAVFDVSEDIKTALDKAKKMFGTGFGKFKQTRKNLDSLPLNEEEFHETGGTRGYVERGRSLMKRQKFRQAIR